MAAVGAHRRVADACEPAHGGQGRLAAGFVLWGG